MTRVISISDDAYERLWRLKNGKSFSEIIVELATNKNKDTLTHNETLITENAKHFKRINGLSIKKINLESKSVMKQTLLICGRYKDSIGVMLGNKLAREYNIRYFSRESSDIQCDITSKSDVKAMLKRIKDQNIKGIINTATIPYKIPSVYENIDVERLSEFFNIKLIGLLNLVHFSSQLLKLPFYFIQIGGALKSEDPFLAHYAMVNRAMEGYIKQLNQNNMINGFYLELGPIKDTRILRLLFDEKTIKDLDKKGLLSTCGDILEVIKQIFDGKISPSTIKIGNFGGI